MTRLHRKVPERFRGAENRVRRTRAQPPAAAREPEAQDLSSLILYGQA